MFFFDRHTLKLLALCHSLWTLPQSLPIADIHCSEEVDRDYSRRSGLVLARACEMLEAAGEFLAAKDVYLLNAQGGPFSSTRAPHEHFMVSGYAGLATKCEADSTCTTSSPSATMDLLRQAETMYIQTWAEKMRHESGRIGDMNDDFPVCKHLTNMMVLYDAICTHVAQNDASAVARGRPGSEYSSPSQDELMLMLTSCLLNAAGLRNVTGKTERLVVEQGSQQIVILKPEY